MAVDLRRHSKRGKAAFEIGGQILDCLKPDMKAQCRPARLPVRCRAIRRAVEQNGEARVASRRRGGGERPS